jgi:hypothetical protein
MAKLNIARMERLAPRYPVAAWGEVKYEGKVGADNLDGGKNLWVRLFQPGATPRSHQKFRTVSLL